MARTKKLTSLFLFATLLGGCSAAPEGPGKGDDVVDPASDHDGDGVIARDDRCPGTTAEARWADTQGCAEHEDGDADGLSTDEDQCPGTPQGEPVDGTGCSASQKEQASGGSGAGTDPSSIEDGEVGANGFASFVLDPQGAFPVVLKTLAKNVKPLATGFELSGTVLIQVPGDRQITLLEAIVEVEYDATQGEGLQSFHGSCRVPFPDIGFMQGVELGDLAIAAVGWDFGKNIENVDAPIKADRKYFYFTFSAGFEAKLNQMTVSTPVNQSVTMTLDPSDPAFFLRASLGGLMGPLDEASLGFSIGGHLPFTPENTWGIESQAQGFDGHLWWGGKVNLNVVKLPIAIGGNTVLDLDPNDDGKTIFEDPAGGMTYASNSELDLSLDAKLLSFEIPIAQATLIGHLSDSAQYGYFSGKIHAGSDWLSGVLPITQSQTLKVAGHVSSKVEETYFEAQGDYVLDASTLGAWTGLDLDDLAMVQATLDIDKNGVLVQGKASTSLSPVIGLQGDVLGKAFFNGDPNDWYVTLDGDLEVKGIDLSAQAHAKLDKSGMFVSGRFETPISLIDMNGTITANHVAIQGSAQVEIPIVAGKEIVQWVTDAAVCGYETVTDAAVCGYQTVQNGALCGYTTMTSVAECGTTTVTSAAQCGTSYVTSGSICGYQTITSGAQCGWDYVSCGWGCVTSLFSDCTCSQPKSCSVPKSCEIANTCQVAATCGVPNTCSVPASCQKVKSCEKKVIIPDFDYGSVKGIVKVKIGDTGLYGSVEGQYCTTSGSCSTIAGGHIDVSSGAPKACIDVASLGEFCAPF